MSGTWLLRSHFCLWEKCQSSFKRLTPENNIYQIFESTIQGFDVIL